MKACSQSPWASLGRSIHSLTWTEAWALPFILCPHLFSTSSPTSVLPLLPVFFSLRRQRRLKWSQSFQEKDDAKEVLLRPPQIQTHTNGKQPIKHTCQRTGTREELPTSFQILFFSVLVKGWVSMHLYQPFKKAPTGMTEAAFLVPPLDHSVLIYFFLLE